MARSKNIIMPKRKKNTPGIELGYGYGDRLEFVEVRFVIPPPDIVPPAQNPTPNSGGWKC